MDRGVTRYVAEPLRDAVAWVRGLSRGRQALGALGIVVLAVALVLVVFVPHGLLGLVIADTAVFDAPPATPSDQALATTGFELNGSETAVAEQQIRPAGQVRTIVVENPQRTYRNRIAVQNQSMTASLFVTLATPAIPVFGSPMNPIAAESHAQIIERVRGDITNDSSVRFREVRDHQATMFGRPTSVSEFRANLTAAGEKRPFSIYVAKERLEDTIVLAIGVHPVAFPDERVAMFRLLDSVDVEAE